MWFLSAQCTHCTYTVLHKGSAAHLQRICIYGASASAVHKYRAAGPSSADVPSSTTPPSNEPATSDALPGFSTQEAQAPIQAAQVPTLAAAPAACTAAAGPAAGSLMLPPPSFGSASAVPSSLSKDSSLSEYELVRVRG